MSLRSPTEYENGRIFLHKDISPSRHSRESGNPGSSHRISLDTPWSLPSTPIGGGYDGIQDAAFLLAPSSIFEGGTKATKDLDFQTRKRRALCGLRGEVLDLSLDQHFIGFVDFLEMDFDVAASF
jgi:hypothetical protein